MPAERLQKVLAASGVASRRGAEALIAAGRVTIDGRPATIGESVDPALVRIAVDGRPLDAERTGRIHLALNKPAGVTSTVRDRHAGRTVVDLVPADIRRSGSRIYPVGRLDRDSEGLLLMTDDGPWAERILHPRFGVDREYAVAVKRPLDRERIDRLRAGFELDEGPASLVAIRPTTRSEDRRLEGLVGARIDPGLVWYRVTLRQGRKRQLRRMFGAIGAPVARLVRVRIGPIKLDGLAPGSVRPLTDREARRLGG
jgi:23S rRNA pseudouridine2605 synthase